MARREGGIGYCIYCGDKTSALSDEHIVPFSLSGGAVLPNASCAKCAKVTSRFEGDIARQQLGAFRVRAGLPTRRPNRRPSKLRFDLIDKDGTKRSVDVVPEQHPGTLLMPDLPEPSLLLATLETPRRAFRIYLALPDEGILQLGEKHDAHAGSSSAASLGRRDCTREISCPTTHIWFDSTGI